MPFGVIRFKKLQASWVSTVGTKGRSLLTQPSSAVAQAIGMSGYRMKARTAQPQVAFSNWLWTVAQSTPSRLGMAMASARRMPASIPMLTSESRLILSGATSSAPVAVARSRAQRLQRLVEVLLALGEPDGERGRLHDRDHRADAVLAQRVDRGGDGALVPDELARSSPAPRRRRDRASTARRSRPQTLKSSSATDASSPTTMRSGSRLPWLIPA